MKGRIDPVSLRAGCPLNMKEELTAVRPKKGVWASQEWEEVLREQMSMKEQNRKTENNKMKRKSTELFAFVWG